MPDSNWSKRNGPAAIGIESLADYPSIAAVTAHATESTPFRRSPIVLSREIVVELVPEGGTRAR